jgi:hypothetical protein
MWMSPETDGIYGTWVPDQGTNKEIPMPNKQMTAISWYFMVLSGEFTSLWKITLAKKQQISHATIFQRACSSQSK